MMMCPSCGNVPQHYEECRFYCDCNEPAYGYHLPNCRVYEEVCGYFTQCEAYQQNLTCEHKGAPVYKKRGK